jgi:hypothetical protein
MRKARTAGVDWPRFLLRDALLPRTRHISYTYIVI